MTDGNQPKENPTSKQKEFDQKKPNKILTERKTQQSRDRKKNPTKSRLKQKPNRIPIEIETQQEEN